MKVLQGQSLFDIACQTLGSAESAIQIALLNGISVTDDLQVGQELEIPGVANRSIVTYYFNKGLTPATGITDTEVATLGGLGYMAIGIDFIIS